jgi:alkaline phosphatase D
MQGRRGLLRAAAALAATRFLGAARAAPSPVRPRHDPFALGVASGDPGADGVVLWTRAVGLEADAAVGFEVAEDEGFRRIVRSGRALAPVARAGAVHLELAGLKPGRPYWYRFHLGDATSRVGRTATVPLRPERLRLALTSCQHWEQGWFSAYADILAQAPDLVLQVGDYIYEVSFGEGPDVRAFGAPVPTTLDDYRARHALYRTDPQLAAAHADLPFVVTWDDHEVENDYAGLAGVATADPAAFVRRRAAAYQAYFEHMPLRPSILRPDGEVRLYRRLPYGDLATLHVLDTRQYRSPHACATAEERGGQAVVDCAEALSPSRTMMGQPQEAWLASGLAGERARWSLIVQQTLFSRLFLPQGRSARYTDIWDGYEANRGRALQALRTPAVRNAVVLGGDVHSFWVNDVREDFERTSPTIATEFVTSCLASRNGPATLFDPARTLNPHVRFLDNSHSGYILLDVARGELTGNLRAVRDLADPASPAFSLGRVVIADGRPGGMLA